MQAMFGSLIAVILPGIYVRLITVASQIVHRLDHPGCTAYSAASFNDQMSFAISTIGGLVSAPCNRPALPSRLQALLRVRTSWGPNHRQEQLRPHPLLRLLRF